MKPVKLVFLAMLTSLGLMAQYNYLGNITADGTPLYFAPADTVSASTITLLRNALPEGFPVPTYNPQYISSGYDTDIILEEAAEVWVTFVDEGAGYKNVLGFYTYPMNNPPTTIPASNAITIIFPNISKAGSGGSLIAGNKVKLGIFPANTGIGFILIADGWRNGAVTNGNWSVYSNPNFNPESNPSLRYHNALIADSSNNRIILGFEDIRRDFGNCDNDFNDALFYITANPYTAIKSSNVANIEDSYQVSSSNNGGLESNGRLAEKIAKRMFERQKGNMGKMGERAFQQQRHAGLFSANSANRTLSQLDSYLPLTGMFGNEISYVSTPVDLLNITNATEVFSSDYYSNNERVAAALVTKTNNKVYDHTKIICDRLNGASLEDVRTVVLKDHKLINTTFKRSSNETEYTITFSVKITANDYSLYSLWSPEQYPSGEYLNFQVWGRTMGQVCNIVNTILAKLESERNVINNSAQTKVPDVFIKKGAYHAGKLLLTVCNRKKTNSLLFSGSSRVTETSLFGSIGKTIPLSGALVQELTINTGKLFDIGFSVAYPGTNQTDALYLADGAWGLDYESHMASDVKFTVHKPDAVNHPQRLSIERNPEVAGNLKGTFNLFRNAKSGQIALDIKPFGNVSLQIQCNKPVEMILVDANLQNWEDRARYTIPASALPITIDIPLSKFVGKNGQPISLEKIKTIVFSVNGDYKQYSSFQIKINDLHFNNDAIKPTSAKTALAFPNPVVDITTLQFDRSAKAGQLCISDASGKTIITTSVQLAEGKYVLDATMLARGSHSFSLTDNNGQIATGKLIKQ